MAGIQTKLRGILANDDAALRQALDGAENTSITWKLRGKRCNIR